jgi:putative sigma-54 modulation protein
VEYAQGSDRFTTEEVAMRLQVKGKNVEVTPSIRAYAERKLGKLEKQLAEQTQVEVELSEQKNPSIAESHVAEATIFTKGPTLRARDAAPDKRGSHHHLVEKLERQLTKYRERRRFEPRRHTEHNGDVSAP